MNILKTFRPEYLKINDVVCIISTARKLTEQEVEPAIKILESWGLKVKLGKNLFESDRQFAGTDTQRADDLQSALNSPEVKAVLCARGGYGTSRIIDRIDFNQFKRFPKWVIGFSDVTVLSMHLLDVIGCESIHAPMAFNLKTTDPRSVEALRKALFGELLSIEWEAKVWQEGKASGLLSGGNLSILFSICGTPSFAHRANQMLFIEDLDEYLYHIDRMVVKLIRSGNLNSLSALIIGAMSDMRDNKVAFGMSAEEIVASNILPLFKGIPVVSEMPLGHVPYNHAVYVGRMAFLQAFGNNAILRFDV